MITGTIGLCASGKPAARVNNRALASGSAQSAGSCSMISSAAMAAATTAGGRPVE